MVKPKYQVNFECRFTFKPKDVERLARDISKLVSMPIPPQLEDYKINRVTIDVSVDNLGNSPYGLSINYHDNGPNECVAFRGFSHSKGKLIPRPLISGTIGHQVME